MKILFAIDSLGGGGAERVISLLANQIHAWGYDVDILLTFSNKIEYEVHQDIGLYDLDGNVLEHTLANKESVTVSVGNSTAVVRKSLLKRMRANISEYRDRKRRIKRVGQFVNEHGYDAVVSFLTSTNELVGATSKKVRAKTIISERCSPIDTVIGQKKGKWTLKQYKKADCVVFQTNDAMACYPSVIREKGVVIPNPIKENLPERFVGERRKEIITFGRLDKQKNLPMLIEAFARLSSEYPTYTLRLFGRGQEKERLFELISELGLRDKVFVEDFASNIHELVRDAAMYISSSDYEGISNSMLEALAIGLPCICTDCPAGGARMAIQDGENGYLVPVRDVEALIAAMRKLMSSSELAEKFSENAVDIKQRWSTEKIAKQWLEVIKG